MNYSVILAGLMTVTGLNAFAQAAGPNANTPDTRTQSQTFVRQSNGTLLTIGALTEKQDVYTPGVQKPTTYDQVAVIREKRMLPLEVTHMGVNYAFFKGGYMATVGADGTFYFKNKQPFEPSVIGGNFFVDKISGNLVIIDSLGYYNICAYNPGEIRLAGSNWFITKDHILNTFRAQPTTVTQPGAAACAEMLGYFNDPKPQATWAGGNYFVNMDGTVVTIDSRTGAISEPYKPDSNPGPLGANYFIGVDNFIYTISNEGVLYKTIQVQTRPEFMGSSFMRWRDGSFAIVTANGGLHQEAVRIDVTNKREFVTKIPSALELSTTFKPVQPRNYR